MLDKFLSLAVVLILTGPVLIVDALLGDRSLHNAWIMAGTPNGATAEKFEAARQRR
jgi:hypothetical protein